jgi:hypothetical protein
LTQNLARLAVDRAEHVTEADLDGFDLPIWLWTRSDDGARVVFERALEKRFQFTSQLFRKAGFSQRDAETRARLMVVYMMGESNLVRQSTSTSKRAIRAKHAILTSRG